MPSKKILIAPLDWGLGHAARCIPIIRYLLEKNCEVIIAADKRPLALLRAEFPSLPFITVPGYNISYPKNGSMALKMAVSIPKIVRGIRREHKQLEEIIKENKIAAVISDNRFGLWSTAVPCVFITHQLMIRSPFGEKLLHSLNKKYILKYTKCWIPDIEGKKENLSGDLAHKFPLPANAQFIGPLSRFHPHNHELKIKNDILVILSGPEPQRTLFENKILEQVKGTSYKTMIVRGITESNAISIQSDNLILFSNLSSEKLEEEIRSSQYIICRPGYSGIMDLATLGKKNIVFVPTPGQTEQEYLAKRFSEMNSAYSVVQNKFDLRTALKNSKNYTGFTPLKDTEHYKAVIERFLASI